MKAYPINHMQVDNSVKIPIRNPRNYAADNEINKNISKHMKSEPNTKICIFERDNAGYGFKITGNAPVKVQAVRIDGIAWISGLRENDVILKVNDVPVADKEHSEVVSLIRKEAKVRLLVKVEQSHRTSNQNISLPKNNPRNSSEPPIHNSNIPISKTQPKPTPRTKPPNESQISKPKNLNSNQGSNKISAVTKEPKENKLSDNENDSQDTSSEYSMTTSSVESESPKKAPSKTLPTFPTTPKEANNIVPLKSNSYNGSINPQKTVTTKKVPVHEKKSPEYPKNKKIIINETKPVNGTSTTDKQHIESIPTFKKRDIKPILEPDPTPKGSKVAISPPKTKPPLRPDIPQDDPHPPKPATLPKPIQRPKSAHDAQYKIPINHILANKDHDIPIAMQEGKENKDVLDTKHVLDTSSEHLLSSSSSESEPPMKDPSKSLPSEPVSFLESPNDIPLKSNSYKATVKLRDDNQDTSNKESIYATLPKKPNNKPFHGFDIDDDLKDDEGSDGSLSLIELLSSTKEALSNAGLVAIILSYVKEKFDDLKIMICYYCCKLYKSLKLRKEFPTESKRMANEIITTFLHEKSPLYTVTNPEVLNELFKSLEVGDNSGIMFDSIITQLFESLKEIVENIRGKINRGIRLSEESSFFVNSINSNINQDKELSLLHRAMCNIITKNQKDGNASDSILATHIGLATMYQFFHKSTNLYGTSIRAKSSDSLNVSQYQPKAQNIGDLFNIKTLCAPYQPKVASVLRKKTKSVNGHVLAYVACQGPKECAICDELLWGTSPQGLFCSMCENYYHDLCRKKIKTSCSKKLKKSNTRLLREDKPPFFERLSRKPSTNSIKSANDNSGNQFFNENSTLPDDKTNASVSGDNNDFPKYQSEDQLNRTTHQTSKRFGIVNERNNSFMNQSVDAGLLPNDQSAVEVLKLVNDGSLDDPDMKMEESFDAEFEINSVFPDISPHTNKKRLIVLLEFYHKTRYILMNLKRFQYSLVNKWPQSQRVYIKALSLDCVDPFVNLIKSLVSTIQSCITEQDFNGMERAVLNWLSDNDDDQLKEWITLSSNLCCTNSLNLVKQLKQTTLRAVPELTDLMRAKFHKIVIIEELSQIRPLLISLPFIVKNIIKCLTKEEPLYSEELSVWSQVSIKLDYICEYIDRCSIPLVDWINKGIIIKRSEKFDFQNKSKDFEKDLKDFCLDFPRTFFHFPIFDFQFAKIMAWYTNAKKSEDDTQTTYLKNGTEVLLIYYKHFILILQKENDHYVLKPIKPLKNTSETQPPIIDIRRGFIVSKGIPEENQFILNFICNEPNNVFLLRIGFSHMEVVDSWLEYIEKNIYDLSRSIRLFKINDLGSVPEVSAFLRTPSGTSIKMKAATDITDSVTIASICPELEVKDPRQDQARYLSLSETLTKASDLLDSNASISSMLNVPREDFPNYLKTIVEEGPKSDDELIGCMFNLSQMTLRYTHQMLARTCPKIEYSADFNNTEFRLTLENASRLLEKWGNTMKTEEEIKPEVSLRDSTEPKSRVDKKPEVPIRLRLSTRSDKCQRHSMNLELLVKSSQYEDVKSIVNEIIDNALKELQTPKTNRESYKYVPSEGQLPAVDEKTYLSEVAITPNYSHINSVVEETITTRTAQIVLHNRNSAVNS